MKKLCIYTWYRRISSQEKFPSRKRTGNRGCHGQCCNVRKHATLGSGVNKRTASCAPPRTASCAPLRTAANATPHGTPSPTPHPAHHFVRNHTPRGWCHKASRGRADPPSVSPDRSNKVSGRKASTKLPQDTPPKQMPLCQERLKGCRGEVVAPPWC
jgi:hypothetical protein